MTVPRTIASIASMIDSGPVATFVAELRVYGGYW